MAQDRFLYWQKDKKPTRDEVGRVCRNYVGGAATVLWISHQSRFIINFPGEVSHPLDGIEGVSPSRQAVWDEEKKTEARDRWIEVWYDETCIDVMTRQQDEFTNGVADGLVAVFQRFWRPSTEPRGTQTPVV